jgi:hypothetical protein
VIFIWIGSFACVFVELYIRIKIPVQMKKYVALPSIRFGLTPHVFTATRLRRSSLFAAQRGLAAVLFVLLAVLLPACVIQTHVVGNKTADYHNQPKNVYILLVGTEETDNFCEGLLTGVMQGFKAKNIPVDGAIRYHLPETKSNEMNQIMATYTSGALFTINIKETDVREHGPIGATFELTLTDWHTKKQTWTGTLKVDGHLNSKIAISMAAKDVVTQLENDGILR